MGIDAFTDVADGAVAYAIGSTSFGASGDDWNGLTVAGLLTWTTTNGEVTITDCDETAIGELIIPDTIEGNPVTSIGEAAFRDCGSLTSITIPGGVTSIGVAAFRNCSSLTSMTIPDSVTSIGDYAFNNCTSLTSITFLGTAPTVATYAFTGVASGAIALVTFEALNSFGESNEKWNGLTLRSTEAPPQSLEVQLAQMTAERDAAILERDARPNQESYDALIAALSLRPTQASFDAVKADRDARPTIEEVKDARLGSVVLQPDGANNNITIRFSIEETDDFRTWTKRDGINEVTVPLEAGRKFYRFALEDE